MWQMQLLKLSKQVLISFLLLLLLLLVVVNKIISDLETLDSIRCFFAVLFLARDKKVEVEQQGDDIEITLIESTER